MSLDTTIILQKDFSSHPLLKRLLELHDIPKQIHVRGVLPKITIDDYGRSTPRILTVVGSRKNSSYGKHALETLISSLAGVDVIILSGLAYGVDELAHKSALNNNLLTIAIPGSGLDQEVIYPSKNRDLAQEIIERSGALISELEDKAAPTPWTFPQRNRIMAALCDALLIVEAEEKSGTLITARQALELGRDIGAIPGEIFSPTSKGTNALIHEGAFCIASSSQLYSLLHISEKEELEKEKNDVKNYTTHEKIIIDLLNEPTDKDTLLSLSELSFEDFLTAFSSLEIERCIQESFGEVRRLV